MRDQRLTEQQNPLSMGIDTMTPLEITDLINSEDQKVALAVALVRESVAHAMEFAVQSLRRGGRLLYVGAGTSGRLGVLDASEMPPTFGIGADRVQGIIAGGYDALLRSKEGAEDRPEDGAAALASLDVGPDDFVLGIATSGTTPFVRGALSHARRVGARTGFLLCSVPDEEALAQFDVVIAPLVGPEVITGSTRMKAGTATKLVLNTITTGAMVLLGKVYGNLMVDLRIANQKLQDRGERILMETVGVDREEARSLLAAAGGHVKVAIVMAGRGVDAQQARALLDAADGRIAGVLGERK